ncbi:MAG: hypothetical protein J6J27_05675 [Alphaproteobacteria bacterium]|nr:hypothetical protein [Alphaproteobacteria bacterium]
MNFFKKLFKKDEINLQDVFNALDKFDNDIKSLREFSEIAFRYFGNNWKFNLEMYISSLPDAEKNKYLSEFKNVMEYEKALSIWTSALQIVKGVKPVSAELLKSMPEYKTYLSKFGIEGERLFEKLNSMFDISGAETKKTSEITNIEDENQSIDTEISNIDNDTTLNIEENSVNNESIDNVSEITTDESVDGKEEISSFPVSENDETKDSQDEETEEEDSLDEDIELSPEKQEYRAQLKQRILQKVRDIELRKNKVKEELKLKENISENKSEINKESKSTDIKPKKNKKDKEKQSINSKKSSNNEVNTTWILQNFKKIEGFLAQSREVMSAISIYKKAPSVEEYKNYGFILDVIDYLVEKGDEILSSKSDDEINSVFAGGRDELRDIIKFYKSEKNNEVIIPEDKKSDGKK